MADSTISITSYTLIPSDFLTDALRRLMWHVGHAVTNVETPNGTTSLMSLSKAQFNATVLSKDQSPPPAPQHRERFRLNDISIRESFGKAFRTLRGEL